MSTVGTIIGILVGAAALLGALWRVGRAIWSAGATTQQLTSAMRDNTVATEKLSAELVTHTTKTTEILSEHDRRITRLEQLRRR